MKRKINRYSGSEEELFRAPERHYSVAAAVIANNPIAGLVIECLVAIEPGMPISVKQIASLCACSYRQAFEALNDLVAADLIQKRTPVQKYVYKDTHPERSPLMYAITERGWKCVGKRKIKRIEKVEEHKAIDHKLAAKWGLYENGRWIESGLFENMLGLVPADDQAKIREQYRKENEK